MSAKGQKVQVPNGAGLIIQLVLWLGESIATSPMGQADTLWLSSLCSQPVRKLSRPVRFSCLDNVHFQLLLPLWRTKMPWLGIFIYLFFGHSIGHLAFRSFMPLASWRDCIYFFICKPVVRWQPPYLDLIACPALYPFWLIPVQLETSRRHHFLLPIHRYICHFQA